jgi:hypothetical protein
MWMIRSLTLLDNHDQPKYWSFNVGWTWRTEADVFSHYDKESVLLPKGGTWEEL